jgi:hypothetical protein
MILVLQIEAIYGVCRSDDFISHDILVHILFFEDCKSVQASEIPEAVI